MRWTIPTLIQQLVDQGVRIDKAADIVAMTYPTTAGDTFYRSDVIGAVTGPAVGVYGLWNSLRGDQSPLGGAKVSDDARTIAQFLRLDGRDVGKIVYVSGRNDHAITTICRRTADAIKRGDYFEPQRVEEGTPTLDLLTETRANMARLDGIGDYIRSIPKPTFGG